MLKRKANRTSEPEIAIAALMVARDRPEGRVSTSHLKKMIPDYIKLTDEDWEESPTRKGEALWHQIVGVKRRQPMRSVRFARSTQDVLVEMPQPRIDLAECILLPLLQRSIRLF